MMSCLKHCFYLEINNSANIARNTNMSKNVFWFWCCNLIGYLLAKAKPYLTLRDVQILALELVFICCPELESAPGERIF